MKKILLKFWKADKSFLVLVCFILFLSFNLVRAINTINELKIENQDLWEQIDRYYPTCEEND